MYHKLHVGAVIVADVHYDKNHQEFLKLLDAIIHKQIVTTQLILLGDIFDLLFGEVKVTHIENQNVIELLIKLSKEIEIIYFEGNHDFNLAPIFKESSIQIIPIENQPALFTCRDKKIYLCHGDNHSDTKYMIYTKIIRLHFVMQILSLINTIFNNAVIKKLNTHLNKKIQCKELDNFEEFIKKAFAKLKLQECDYYIEGHFHQNRHVNLGNFEYINIGAFACNQRYFVVQSQHDANFLQECSIK